MNVHKFYNFPALHKELKLQFTYVFDRQYLIESKYGMHAGLPTGHDTPICKATQVYLYKGTSNC